MAPDFRKPFRALSLRPRMPAAQKSAETPEPGQVRSSLINNAIYENGCRVETPASLSETYAALDARPGAMAWIGLYRPTTEELTSLAGQFGLHELAVEDAIVAHQRPKIERSDPPSSSYSGPLAISTPRRRWSSVNCMSSWAATS